MTTTYPNRAVPASRGASPALPPSVTIEKPPYLMAACVSLGALILYILTLAPTTQFWDTSEYIAAAYTLGIPHPPGNPLFVLMAHVWGLIPFVQGYAERINLFAAVTSAVSAGCWFLVAERWLRSFVPARLPRRLCAIAGALVSATSFTVWNQSVVNEKVYTLSLLSIALILWLIVRWDDQPPGEAHDHYLLLIVYLLALTATNHMMGVLVGPVVLVLLYPPLKTQRPVTDAERTIEWSQFFVVLTAWFMLLTLGLEHWQFIVAAGVFFVAAFAYAVMAGNATFALAALGMVVVGLSVYTFLPIRAAFYPPINEGEPTNWQALWAVLSRQQYGKPSIFDDPTQAPGAGNPGHTLTLYWAQLVNYAQYFAWQFGHDWSDRLQRVLAAFFFMLGLGGGWRPRGADRRTAIAMTLLVVTFTFALVLPELQVRVLAAPRSAALGARGAPARLLLHLLVRDLGHLDRDGSRGAAGDRGRLVQRARARSGEALDLRRADSPRRARAARRQSPDRVPQRRDAGARLRVRHPAIGRALRRARHRRRQRHISALVRAGSRAHPPGRHDRQPVARQYGLVRPAAPAAPGRAVRLAARARDLSRPPVADADRETHEFHRRAARRARAVLLDRPEAHRRARQRRRHGARHDRPADARPALPGARRHHRAPGDQGSDGQAADHVLTHRRPLRRSVRLYRPSGRPRLHARAARAGDGRVGQHQGDSVAGVCERAAHVAADVRRLSRRRRRAAAAARLGGQAVRRDSVAA